jgi:molybdate transport repressor ModE-like protein
MRFFIRPDINYVCDTSEPRSLARVLLLLAEIEGAGNLRAASKRLGVSYRHAWNMLAELEALLGYPAVEMTRGRGSQLTELGSKLVWAHRQTQARLGPLLDSMASEIEAEIQTSVARGQGALRLYASHGFAIDALHKRLIQRNHELEINYRGSLDAVDALYRGACDIAGFHIPEGKLVRPVLEKFMRFMKPSFRLICLVTRRQGIMVAKGNPKKIWEITDLKRPGIRFVNRQESSGTRALLELLLKNSNISTSEIDGFESIEFTHAAVASYIARSKADAGLGVEPAARQFHLDFVPLLAERYFLMFDEGLAQDRRFSLMMDIMASNEFKAEVGELPGYYPSLSIDIMTPAEAFPVPPDTG